MKIPPEKEGKFKNLLYDFVWPTKSLDEWAIKKYLQHKPDDAFQLFFKNMIETTKKMHVKNNNESVVLHKKMGIFISNDYGEVGLVVKCDGELFVDTTGIIMAMVNKFYFKPHFQKNKPK